MNDRKRIQYIIEKLVETQFNPEENGENVPLYMTLENLHPFSIVDEVFPKSPAEEAHLEAGDFVLSIGKANNMFNHYPIAPSIFN